MKKIILKKVQVHNLQAVDLELEPGELIVFTGVSGSGKSSLAFDTIYSEGQRRYVESLSHFARRYLGDLPKPEAEHISGLTPTISIEQKTAGRNPRSTVGTMTEIYDYLRVLYARVAIPHCPISGEAVRPQSRERIIREAQGLRGRLIILAPFVKGKKGELKDDLDDLRKRGFVRARVDGEIVDLSEEIALDGSVSHTVEAVIDRLGGSEENVVRIAEAVTMALEVGEGLVTIVCDAEEQLYSMHAYSPASGMSYAPLEPQGFSFNHPGGMCQKCQGLGVVEDFDLDIVIDEKLSIADDCCSVATSYQTVRYRNIYRNLARIHGFSVSKPWKKLSEEAREVFLHGAGEKSVRMRFIHPETGKRWTDYVRWKGVLWEAKQRYAEAKSDVYRNNMRKLMRRQVCTSCKGSRLAAYPAAAKLNELTIGQLCTSTIGEAHQFFDQLRLPELEMQIAEELIKEIRERLRFLLDVGLHYLTLERTAPTLSGGEAQRVRLASQIGCGLVGVTYVLDEPSIGLHPRDNRKLISTLLRLRDQGNTVIVVEHDEETIWAADKVVEFGPGAGSRGGQIVVAGSRKELLAHPESVTGAYLSGRKKVPVPEKLRERTGTITVKGARHHNLNGISVEIPLGCLVAVTGVSGSGKSSLVSETLYPALANELQGAELEVGKHDEIEGLDGIEKVISVDQSPIGRNPRSNPATYIKLFDEIRDLFTKLPESAARGYKPGRFSFNVATGSCSQCKGMGQIKIDMDFMEASWVPCDLCKGHRFDPETLEVRFKEKSIYDVLEMEIDEAYEFFANVPRIARKLETLVQVGLGYLKLGQSSTTLSGGEAQRIKLAKELSRPSQGKSLYLLDEPTTGLHFHDITHLLEVIHRLVDAGNTVLVIEHNMDVVRAADWIIDLGPEGGAGGGEIIATGTPEELSKLKTPTGLALADVAQLQRHAKRVIKPVQSIVVEKACQNNLKGVSAEIARGAITVCTGPSGSGKSSFAFETLYAEGQRRYTESLSPYARQFVKQMAKPKVEAVEGLSPAIAIEQKHHAGNPRSTVGTLTEIYDYLRILYARAGTAHCPETGEVIRAISKEYVVDRLMLLPEGDRLQILAPMTLDKGHSFEELVLRLTRQGYLRLRLDGTLHELDGEIPFEKRRKHKIELVVDRLKVSPANRARLFEAVEAAAHMGENQVVVLHGEEELLYNLAFAVESTGKSYPAITPATLAFNKAEGQCNECHGWGDCQVCGSERLAPLGRNVLLEGLSLGQLCLLPAEACLTFIKGLKLDATDAKLLDEVQTQLVARLSFLCDVGLHYLALHRGAPTLSNGEAQRIRLARQLGSGLTGCLYVLDEPTIGLHPVDIDRLQRALVHLRDLGNTIVMVEHDPMIIERADHLLTFGPGAGHRGGEIVEAGEPVALPEPRRREAEDWMTIEGADAHNLKNLDITFPLGALTCITGPSGSGKSSLMHEVFIPTLADEELIVLDQNPIGRTIRADVGTFSDIMPAVRALYAQLPRAVTLGLAPGAFSYNHPKGFCSRCWGLGHRRIEMHFLPPVRVTCDGCNGLRLKPTSLEPTFKGKNFGQLLTLTVEQARELFANQRAICRRLDSLIAVGLGYLTLGQRIATLSGGEAQRMKISRELAKRTKQKAIYLLDEPTTGLHRSDVGILLDVLNKLVDKGHTVIVVEHNLDFIARADHIIELGPEAGEKGGYLVAEGTPAEIAAAGTATGQYLIDVEVLV